MLALLSAYAGNRLMRGRGGDSDMPLLNRRSEQMIDLAVQVNGKMRGTVRVRPDVTQEEAFEAAMAVPAIARFVTGPPKKIIFVPGRLLNVVV